MEHGKHTVKKHMMKMPKGMMSDAAGGNRKGGKKKGKKKGY